MLLMDILGAVFGTAAVAAKAAHDQAEFKKTPEEQAASFAKSKEGKKQAELERQYAATHTGPVAEAYKYTRSHLHTSDEKVYKTDLYFKYKTNDPFETAYYLLIEEMKVRGIPINSVTLARAQFLTNYTPRYYR